MKMPHLQLPRGCFADQILFFGCLCSSGRTNRVADDAARIAARLGFVVWFGFALFDFFSFVFFFFCLFLAFVFVLY